jgi:hypothetical protein
MLFPHGESVTFEALSVGAEDAHGNPVDSYGSPVIVAGCAFDPGGTVESFEPGRDVVITSPRVFIPSESTVPVSSRDRVTVRGVLYEVDGDPAVWVNPFTGWNPGRAVPLERAAG